MRISRAIAHYNETNPDNGLRMQRVQQAGVQFAIEKLKILIQKNGIRSKSVLITLKKF